jgi:hypothetical protein
MRGSTEECPIRESKGFGVFCGPWYPSAIMRVLGIILVAIIGVGLLGPTARFG